MPSLIVRPDASIEAFTLPAAHRDQALTMRKLIGCDLLAAVQLTSHVDMWLDDNGIGSQKINALASVLAMHFGFTHQVYYGPVVLCGFDQDGDTIDLGADRAEALLGRLLEIRTLMRTR